MAAAASPASSVATRENTQAREKAEWSSRQVRRRSGCRGRRGYRQLRLASVADLWSSVLPVRGNTEEVVVEDNALLYKERGVGVCGDCKAQAAGAGRWVVPADHRTCL